MDVFLVPVAPDRYELYCEEPDDPVPGDDEGPPKGFVGRIVHRFRVQLAEAEHAHRRETDPDAARPSFAGRVKARTLRWIAEAIAEQRLLWQLRSRASARLFHPDDLTDAQARQLLRRSLQRDWEKHRFWLVVDSLGGIGSLLLVLIPGPNVLGYYFAFRIVGHYLSLRGARRGLVAFTWTLESSRPLATLRTVVSDPPESRAALVREVEATLRLERLAVFFQRTATP